MKKKFVWQMTGEEFLFLINETRNNTIRKDAIPKHVRKKIDNQYVYGLKGIAKLFGCSVSSAMRLKKSGKINDALVQEGRKIIVDA
ncbi:DUF3853 family protein [Chryseobacterium indicum]|uniref:DUF3853 family protein n=1 Tax=Chryseobacterium indicum TaxID=2766954 RepID=UPI001F1AB66E